MNLDYFRNFIMIVDSQTLTEAAKRLNMVQPALSAQLKQIEHIYQAELLLTNRGSRGIELTEAGEVFYRRAKDILRITDGLKKEVAHIAQGGSGTLRVGITPGAVRRFIDDYLVPFTEKYPEFHCHFNEGNVDQQEEALLTGVVDFGVTNEPVMRGGLFDLIDVRYRQLTAVALKGKTWLNANKSELKIEELASMPLCVTRSIAGRLENLFRERGLSDNVRGVCGTKELAVHWARRGFGVALVTGPVEYDTEELIQVPLARKELLGGEYIYRVKGRELTTIAQKFCDFIKEKQ